VSPHKDTLSANGVWLGTNRGRLFFPLSDDQTSSTGEPVPSARSSESQADREALDAACWLMPSLPREFIAEVLQLGSHRPVSGCAVSG
jgi:hypothetical protein